jgi:hypothetical protein
MYLNILTFVDQIICYKEDRKKYFTQRIKLRNNACLELIEDLRDYVSLIQYKLINQYKSILCDEYYRIF